MGAQRSWRRRTVDWLFLRRPQLPRRLLHLSRGQRARRLPFHRRSFDPQSRSGPAPCEGIAAV